jgi:hypothetical protein
MSEKSMPTVGGGLKTGDCAALTAHAVSPIHRPDRPSLPFRDLGRSDATDPLGSGVRVRPGQRDVWRRERRENAGRPVARSVPYTHTLTHSHSNADADADPDPHTNAVPGSQRVAWPVPAAVVRQSPRVPAAAP